ncbi:MAG: nucleotidyl transferase AbiEii/AbiGii toxin family protein [Candidatus Taylorbacteria bacterium]|nr:nucleotidyl transferase AbiEii/AbiGii toxin family protein [Candidatus Taylorbacteria bacterium]
MEELMPTLKRLLVEAPSSKTLFRRNVLEEYLQIVVLDHLYSDPVYGQLVFYGGSCLAQCHGLPRLSEDLDFVDIKGKIEIGELADDIASYFRLHTDLNVVKKTQKFRILLKFPVLKELGLSGESDSDFLQLKVEIFRDDGLLRDCPVEAVPLFKMNRSIIVKAFDLPTLMATKIRAVLHWKWEKTDKSGKTLATVKGRDYFDLMWYLRKGVTPNMACLKEVTGKEELKRLLLDSVDKADPTSIKIDLEALIADDHYVTDVSANLRQILKTEIEKM